MDLLSEMMYPTPVRMSPLLPLLLMSLSQDKHAPNIATRLLDEYDYVVVGGGSAGSVVAGRLSEIASANVLLLEAGKSPPKLTDLPIAATAFLNTDIDWQYSTEPQKYTGAGMVDKIVPWPNGKTLGGSSTINGMFGVRGNRRDFDNWATQGCAGWSYEEVLPYFIKMENYTDPLYRYNGFHGTTGPLTIENLRYHPDIEEAFSEAAILNGYRFVDINGPSQIGFYNTRENMRNAQRCSTAKAYLVPAENRRNLHIVPNAMVTKIMIRNRRATGVRFDLQGQSYEVRARKEVVLSAGAVGSPKLLMLSGIGPAERLQKLNIDVVADLPVGENLQDHVTVPLNFVLDENIVTPYDRRITNETIMEYIFDRTGPLSISYASTLLYYLKNPASRSPKDVPDFQTYITENIVDEELRQYLNLEPQAFEKVYGPYRNKPIFICHTFAANPLNRGTLKLRSDYPYDKPIIDPRYFEHRMDVENTISGMKTCLKLATSSPMLRLGSQPFQTVYPGCESYELYSDDYLRCIVRTSSYSEFHYTSTVKMGHPEDPTAVVDPQLRVKTIRGLRVADASIMPSITSGNTNLPTIMIGEKASDMIKEDYPLDRKKLWVEDYQRF